MRQSHKFLATIDSSFYRRYLQQMLMIVGFILFSLGSSSAFAADNPGATCSGIAGASQGSLKNADYTSILSNTGSYVTVAGNAAGSIPLQIKMTISEKNGPPTSGSFAVATVGNDSAFNLVRNFPSVDSVTSVDLDFRNRVTEQPIFLTNVALSAFDIDYALDYRNAFDDYVLFSGVTASGDTINGSYQSLQAAGSNIRAFSDSRPNTSGLGLYTTNTNTATECPGTNLDVDCQGSVQFSEPVSSVKIRYSNVNYRTSYRNPTNQQIFFRVDNYCYVPQYIFSGTVFNDNGGITAAQATAVQASANPANFTSGAYNNTNYFNGVFNQSQEMGISDSTVRLASCDNNNSPTYATQTVNSSGATIGQFQFSVPLSTFGSNRSICLIESRTGNSYPIRTTTDNINTGFTTTTYHYPNRNFGRVITENAALVLRKAQFVNDCPSTLDYTASTLNTPGNTNPRTGFSESSISGSELIPGQCIAYRITATNRSNLVINDFVMQDKLQKKGDKGALVTSVLTGPIDNDSNYALTSSVPIGENGTVVTTESVINSKASRRFYFNTKYGTTVDP